MSLKLETLINKLRFTTERNKPLSLEMSKSTNIYKVVNCSTDAEYLTHTTVGVACIAYLTLPSQLSSRVNVTGTDSGLYLYLRNPMRRAACSTPDRFLGCCVARFGGLVLDTFWAQRRVLLGRIQSVLGLNPAECLFGQSQ